MFPMMEANVTTITNMEAPVPYPLAEFGLAEDKDSR
jgi:hypothetical protein